MTCADTLHDKEGLPDSLIKDNKLKVDTGLMQTAFGELSVAEPTPVIQVSAQYGLTDEMLEICNNGGFASNGDSLYRVSTGTDPNGLASLNTNKQLAYKSGQGALARFTSLFTLGVADNLQIAGLINSEDSFTFGYLGTSFGIVYFSHGVTEHQELTITTAGGNENATVTVNGNAYIVALTAGTANHTAQEIATSLSAQVENFQFTANNNIVSAMDLLPEINTTYAFSAGTAAGTWVQNSIGKAPVFSHVPRAAFNRDNVEWLDPTKGNVYSISIQYLGFGNIRFFVEDEITGNPILVHVLEYANKNIIPSVGNPTFRIGWACQNSGNTSPVTVSGASAAGFIEGKRIVDTVPRALEALSSVIAATQTNVLTIRNRFHFGNKINRADIIPVLISMGTESTKGAFFRLIANAEFNGDVNFDYVDKANSVVEYSRDNVEITSGSGRFVGSFLVRESGAIITSDDFPLRIFPDDTLTLAAAVTATPSAIMTATLAWQEDT